MDESHEARYLLGAAQLAAGELGPAEKTFAELPAALSAYGLAHVAAARRQPKETLQWLAAAEAAAGDAWRPALVAADAAFEFVADTPEFRALTAR